jgi:glucosamine--fructose-6-phosphate aminotransferase (isomerizing)
VPTVQRHRQRCSSGLRHQRQRLHCQYWLEAIAGIPCQVEVASEYRYRTSVPNPAPWDHHQAAKPPTPCAALRHAPELGMTHTLTTICNVATSAMSGMALA